LEGSSGTSPPAVAKGSRRPGVAESLGLDYDEDGPELTGEHRSTSIRVYTESHDGDPHDAGDSMDTRTVKTFYETSVSEVVPDDLVLGPEDWSVSLGKLVGMEDLEIGHAEFDDHFVVQTEAPERARAYLEDASRRRALMEFQASCDGIPELKKGRLSIREMGAAQDADRMRRNIEALVTCADALREHAPRD
jgi:hypothetical protein